MGLGCDSTPAVCMAASDRDELTEAIPNQLGEDTSVSASGSAGETSRATSHLDPHKHPRRAVRQGFGSLGSDVALAVTPADLDRAKRTGAVLSPPGEDGQASALRSAAEPTRAMPRARARTLPRAAPPKDGKGLDAMSARSARAPHT